MSAVPRDLEALCHLREDGAVRTHYGRIVVDQPTNGETLSGRVEFDG
jgi:hypothetical protein